MAYFDNNPWHYWQSRIEGIPMQMNPSHPQAGFYRMPRKEYYGARRTFKPVAYWPEDGVLKCRIGDENVSPEKGQGIWERVGNHPVTEEAYRQVAQFDGLWPDEHELVPMQGDNMPPEDDSFEGLTERIEDLAREANARLDGPAIKDQDEADRIANLADALAELCGKAEERRKEERRPFDEGMKEVQKRWAPVLLKAESYKNLKYKLLTPWLQALDKERAKATEAAAAAGAPSAGEPRRPRAGTRGRAMTLKSQKRAEIIDYSACLAFFRDSDDVRGTVQMLANRAVRTGIAVPGTQVVEEEKAV